ncbi:DUF2218 domain-containing protein [Chromatiaceae bacterium AAb-1]|nr:DUF2218 domain-containing protein [Chromatiaceae bacterium AAb-1]
MATVTASVTTTRARDYMRKLCIHWSHRFEVSFDEKAGSIQFGDGKQALLQVQDNALLVTVSSADEAGLSKLADVVAEHISRYAQKESLQFVWNNAD